MSAGSRLLDTNPADDVALDGDEADARVAAAVAGSGTSFYWAMKFLPRERRSAMFAIYAFCRAVDDVVDEPGTMESKEAQLAEWRREIARIYEGSPRTLIGRQLAVATRRFDLQRDDFLAIIDGMAMDAGAPMQAPSMAELDLYCARVASAVGLLSVRAFGAPAEEGRRVAHVLGRAFQLTNILRDLAEDAAIGRLYLPRELLAANGIDSSDPQVVLRHPGLAGVCTELARLAQGYFDQATVAMAACPRRSMRPARVMMEVYHRILHRLLARGWRRPDEPVSLPKATKLFIALRYGLF
jgi:phytoene synthase